MSPHLHTHHSNPTSLINQRPSRHRRVSQIHQTPPFTELTPSQQPSIHPSISGPLITIPQASLTTHPLTSPLPLPAPTRPRLPPPPGNLPPSPLHPHSTPLPHLPPSTLPLHSPAHPPSLRPLPRRRHLRGPIPPSIPNSARPKTCLRSAACPSGESDVDG